MLDERLRNTNLDRYFGIPLFTNYGVKRMKNFEVLPLAESTVEHQQEADINFTENRETEDFEAVFVIELTGIVFSTSGKFNFAVTDKSENNKHRVPSLFNQESFL